MACGVLSALPDDGTAGSLDELAILACALRTWPSTTSPPDAAATRDGAAFIRGLGFESLEPVAAKFALLEAGGYRNHTASGVAKGASAAEKAAAASAGARVSSTATKKSVSGSAAASSAAAAAAAAAGSPRSSASPAFGSAFKSLRASRSDGNLSASVAGAANRREFFRDVCDAMGAAGGTSAEAWAQALRSLAAAAATAESTPAARAAAAELLVAWIDARVGAEGEGAWETRALAAAASELAEMDDPALAPAVTALASPRATADPAAVVDAILLGKLVPHADAVAEDDVKVRLPAWTPPGMDSERVRGVSRANEDRLRRWATAWMRDALTSAESLLAKGGGRADESAYVSAGEESEDDAGTDAAAADPFAGVVEPTPDPTTVPVPAHILGFESPFAPKRARVAPGAKSRASGSGLSGKGGFAAAIFAARWKNKSGLGGVSPATSRKERRRIRATGTSSADEEPATSPAASRRRVHAAVFRAPPSRERIPAEPKPESETETATETVTGDGEGDREPEETPTDRRGERLGGGFGGLPPVPMDATETRAMVTPAATVGGGLHRVRDAADEEEEEAYEEEAYEEEAYEEEEEESSREDAARLRSRVVFLSRERADDPGALDEDRDRERRSRSARIDAGVGDDSDVDDLIESMGEMQTFEVDVDAEEVTVSPGATRRLRRDDFAYAEAKSKLRSNLGARWSRSEAA